MSFIDVMCCWLKAELPLLKSLSQSAVHTPTLRGLHGPKQNFTDAAFICISEVISVLFGLSGHHRYVLWSSSGAVIVSLSNILSSLNLVTEKVT